MTLYLRLYNHDSLIPISIDTNTTLKDVANDIKQYIRSPKFMYLGEEVDAIDNSLADLGICPESIVDVGQSHDLMILFSRTYVYGSDDYYILDPIDRCIHCIGICESDIYFDSHPLVKDGNTYSYNPTTDMTQKIILNDEGYEINTHTSNYSLESSCYRVDKIDINIFREQKDLTNFLDKLQDKYNTLDINYKVFHI